jgi:hypothetical protein
VAAYPFWLPEPEPATYCGQVNLEARTFDLYQRAETRELLLRPSARPRPAAPRLEIAGEATFENGAMVASADQVRARTSAVPCTHHPAAAGE